MEIVVGLVIVLAVVFVVAIIFYPQISPLYDDVKKIAQEVLNLKPTEEEIEKDLRVKQVFNKVVESIKKCVESNKEDCGCDLGESEFSDEYTLKFSNEEDGLLIEVYKVEGEGAGMLIKKEKIAVKNKFAWARHIYKNAIECTKRIGFYSFFDSREDLVIRQETGQEGYYTFISYKLNDPSFPEVYKSIDGDICFMTSGMSFLRSGIPRTWFGFADYNKFKEDFNKKDRCV